MTWTPTTLTIKDGAGNSQPVIAYTDGTNFSLAHPLLDDTGAIVAPATQGTLASVLSALQGAIPPGNNAIGQVTANAGANLNTSALALESGGNLASVATSNNNINTATGAVSDAAYTGTGSSSIIAALKGIFAKVAGTLTVAGTVTANAGTGTMAVSAASLPLPAGAATSANQSTANTSLATIATNTTGAATAANQATANSSLATIATNSTGIATAANQSTTNAALASLLTEIQNSQRPNIVAGNTTTRPANTTAYAASQLLANSTTAGSVTYPTIAAARANDQAGTILRLRLKKSGTTLTNGIFRVHLYNSQPTVTNGDGAAWLSTTSGYLGAFDVTMTQAFSDGAMGIGISTAGSGVAFNPATGTQNLYYLIEVRAAYTPASGEVFTPYLEVA